MNKVRRLRRELQIEEGLMNHELFRAKWNQFKGESKQRWGRFTGNERLQLEGDYDKFIGKIQEFNADQKDADEWWSEQQKLEQQKLRK